MYQKIESRLLEPPVFGATDSVPVTLYDLSAVDVEDGGCKRSTSAPYG